MSIIFLDRDGVINQFPGDGKYVTRLKDFHLLPRSVEAIRILTEQGYATFVVSNQAGVGRKIYSRHKLEVITGSMIKDITAVGGKLTKVMYCTHRSDQGCACRKPEIGNIAKALKSIGKTLRSAKDKFFVGDTKSDILCGYNAGCKTILVLSGRAKRSQIKNWGVKPDFVAPDLLTAVKQIVLRDLPVSKRLKRSNDAYFRRAKLHEVLKTVG
ncbi:MAG: HAD-IIIA family hydrolase [Candidatus Omnitrophica bacterium]|nr:HAD-IIIA family hydrolase [Candidatus Omnitrophota bacterium]